MPVDFFLDLAGQTQRTNAVFQAHDRRYPPADVVAEGPQFLEDCVGRGDVQFLGVDGEGGIRGGTFGDGGLFLEVVYRDETVGLEDLAFA